MGIVPSLRSTNNKYLSKYYNNENNFQQRQQLIEEKLLQDLAKENEIIKILLLGNGECGKSTILKQMKILHLNGFKNDQERVEYRNIIWNNICTNICKIRSAMIELDIPYDDKSIESMINKTYDKENLLNNNLKLLQSFWNDRGIQLCYTRRNEYGLIDNCFYYFKHLERIFSHSYIPSKTDILYSRQQTQGIITTEFNINQTNYCIYDVGGQRGERKQWIHIFNDVTAIMFIGALSEYDLYLNEDRSKNRMEESLDLFETIVNMIYFKEARIILFLNKNDLFEEKIENIPIDSFFPEYNGEIGSYEAGLKFIYDEYMDCVPQNKQVYVHVTDATNTDNIKFVWDVTQHIILEQALTTGEYAMF